MDAGRLVVTVDAHWLEGVEGEHARVYKMEQTLTQIAEMLHEGKMAGWNDPQGVNWHIDWNRE